MARKEIGEAKVQAEDYAYTIQGWLKSVNGEQLNSSTAMGKDNQPSTINANGAKDAFGYSLSYYNGDYNSSNTTMLGFSKHAAIGTQLGPDLYNGNIRAMHTAISNPTTETIQGGYTHQTVYKYDQLNRIIGMNGFKAITPGVSPDSSGYKSAYSYDANGNLQTMNNRSANGSGVATPMDAFVYNYKPNTNQLTHVDDAITTTNFAVDLDDQSANNYSYDAIGQLIGDVAENITSITWTVTNKVKTVTYGGSLAGKSITFNYDAMGHRISKQVTATNGDVTTTYYVLDAKGNPISTYERKKDGSVYNVYLAERNIYGSSRLGSEDMNQQMTAGTPPAPGANYAASNSIGDKRYELANHLGNVLNVVTDRKLPSATGTFPNQTVGAYTADVVSYSDYYPFGMVMPNRSLSDYRYGFNGMEKDDEIKSNAGSSYDFGARMYDPRVGRWLSVDPLAGKYLGLSPYNFVANNPIIAIDPDGKDIIIVTSNGTFKAAKETLLRTPEGKALWEKYAKSKTVDVYIAVSTTMKGIAIAETVFDISNTSMVVNNKIVISNADYENFSVFKNYDVKASKNKGKAIALIVFDATPNEGNFSDTEDAQKKHAKQSGNELFNDYDNAEVLFHELKAHVDLDGPDDHKAYGNTHNGVMRDDFNAVAGKPADMIRKSLIKLWEEDSKALMKFTPRTDEELLKEKYNAPQPTEGN